MQVDNLPPPSVTSINAEDSGAAAKSKRKKKGETKPKGRPPLQAVQAPPPVKKRERKKKGEAAPVPELVVEAPPPVASPTLGKKRAAKVKIEQLETVVTAIAASVSDVKEEEPEVVAVAPAMLSAPVQ